MTYGQKLSKLQKEVSSIGKTMGGKFRTHQKKMVQFINGSIDKVEFEVLGKKVVLERGDENKGFQHIIEKHYAPNDLEAIDILNLLAMFKKDAIQMANHGVSNNALTVYARIKNNKEHRLVINETREDKPVVTTYRKT